VVELDDLGRLTLLLHDHFAGHELGSGRGSRTEQASG
jgi:hypothetical protein